MSATQKIWSIAILIDWLDTITTPQTSLEMRNAATLLIERALKEPPE